MVACTPLRDLSTYSGEPESNAGAGSGTVGAVVGTPSDPASRRDVAGAASGGGTVELGSPVPVVESDVGSSDAGSSDAGPSDAGSSSPTLACDGPGDVAAEAGGCYTFVAEAASWATASAVCSAWGGALAQIESSDEEAFVLEGTSANTWVGLNDRETEGSMRWDGGAELGTYSNWAAEQPDDFDGTEDCVELLADGRGWNDRPCTDLRVYVCER
jgi:hypothetical protein